MPDRTLILIDAYAAIYRSYYAIPPFTSADGVPTNALYGFIRTLHLLKRRWRPTHWAVVFDGGIPAARTEWHAAYKADREAVPDPLEEQLDLIDDYLERARVPWFCIEHEEADDVIATLAGQAHRARARVLVVTNDKDLYQVVGKRVALLRLDKTMSLMTSRDVRHRTGVPPSLVASWLALMGDRVDNIEGVPGVGPKTAARLLMTFRSIEGIWAHLDEVRGPAIQAALRANRKRVTRNLELVRLRTHLPVKLAWRELRLRQPDRNALRSRYEEWGFRTLARELRGADGS